MNIQNFKEELQVKNPKKVSLKLDFTEVRNLVYCMEITEGEGAYVDHALFDRLEHLKNSLME